MSVIYLKYLIHLTSENILIKTFTAGIQGHNLLLPGQKLSFNNPDFTYILSGPINSTLLLGWWPNASHCLGL